MDDRVRVIPPKTVYRTIAEVEEARARREAKRRKAKPKPRMKYRNKRQTVRKCISIPPELFVRAQRDLGQGNFSKAVVESLRESLRRWDEENGAIYGKQV